MAPDVHIQVCGRLAVRVGGERLEDALPRRQGRLLFTYLVVHRARAISRDELIEALWGDGAPSAPEAALRVLLSRLRAALGPDLVAGGEHPGLRLPPDAFVDLEAALEGRHRAQSAVAQQDWVGAWGPARVALHTGNRGFLPGVDAPWIAAVRATLEETRLAALECIAVSGLALGGPEVAAAERAARALIAAAPFQESGYRHLMLALRERGDVAEALRAYEGLRVLLRDELGIAPDERVRAVYQELIEG